MADAVKLPVLNVGDAADRLREQDCRAAPVPPAAERAHARRRAGADAGVAQVEQAAAARRPEPAGRSSAPPTAQASIKRYGLQVVATQALQAVGRPARARPRQPAAADGRRQLRRGLGGRQRRRVRARPAVPHRAAAPGGRRCRPGGAGLACAVRALRRAAGVAPLRQGGQAADDRRTTGRRGWPARRWSRPRPRRPKGPAAAWAQALAKTPLDGSKGVDAELSRRGTASCARPCC